MLYRTLEIFATPDKRDELHELGIGSLSNLKNLTVATSFSNVFKLVPYHQKNGQGSAGGENETVIQLSQIDTEQKRGVFRKALTVMARTNMINQLCIKFQNKDKTNESFSIHGSFNGTGEDLVAYLTDKNRFKLTNKVEFNAYYLVIFMILLTSYDVFKNGNDFDNDVLKVERLKKENSQEYLDYWFATTKEHKTQLENDSKREAISDHLTPKDPFFEFETGLMDPKSKEHEMFDEGKVRSSIPFVEWNKQNQKAWETGEPLRMIDENVSDRFLVELAEFYNYLLVELPLKFKNQDKLSGKEAIESLERDILLGFFDFSTRNDDNDVEVYRLEFEDQVDKVQKKQSAKFKNMMGAAFSILVYNNPVYTQANFMMKELKQITGAKFSKLSLDYPLLISSNEQDTSELVELMYQLGARYQRHLGSADLAHRVTNSLGIRARVPAAETLFQLRLNHQLDKLRKDAEHLMKEASEFDAVFDFKQEGSGHRVNLGDSSEAVGGMDPQKQINK